VTDRRWRNVCCGNARGRAEEPAFFESAGAARAVRIFDIKTGRFRKQQPLSLFDNTGGERAQAASLLIIIIEELPDLMMGTRIKWRKERERSRGGRRWRARCGFTYPGDASRRRGTVINRVDQGGTSMRVSLSAWPASGLAYDLDSAGSESHVGKGEDCICRWLRARFCKDSWAAVSRDEDCERCGFWVRRRRRKQEARRLGWDSEGEEGKTGRQVCAKGVGRKVRGRQYLRRRGRGMMICPGSATYLLRDGKGHVRLRHCSGECASVWARRHM